MKNAIWILSIVASCYFLYNYSLAKPSAPDQTELVFDSTNLESPINVVAYQDASGSISQNGVELMNSSLFCPYFKDIHRDIQLSFGIINELSARKLITIELKAARLPKPQLPTWERVPITLKNKLRAKYEAAQRKYALDSLQYSKERDKVALAFCKKVDSAIAPYRIKLSDNTDLVTAIKIADKVFNYSFSGDASNYLLLNSDGIDSYHRLPAKLKNKAEVILINANGNVSTSVDSIVTRFFQSSEQAIEFTLNNQN